MATVGTTTQTDALTSPGLPPISRDMTNGRLYCVIRTSSTQLTVYRSTDSGGSWGSFASFTHTGLQEWSQFFVDNSGYGHIAYRAGDATADTAWYRRLNLSTAAWSSALQTNINDTNSGSIGSRIQGVDLAVVHMPNGTYAIITAVAYNYLNNTFGAVVNGVSISAGGTITLNNSLILNKRFWVETGSPGTAHSGISCEIEHNGDGVSSQVPHLWITWGRTALRMVKLAWQGSVWSGPSNHQIIRTGLTANDNVCGRFDGNQWLMPVISPDDAAQVKVYQRNKANTSTTTFDTPDHPQGNIRSLAVSYDAGTKDIRVFAVGTTTPDLYFVDYDRSAGSWNSWSLFSATDVLNSGLEWGVRHGGTTGNARFDVVTAAAGSPNTVTHTAQSFSTAPNTALWDTSAQPYFNGGAADVAASLTLDWTFTDPDPGQGQGSYALSRQIGAGALQYYTAAGGTWGGSEVQNSTSTTQVTLSSGWASSTDANYTFRVKVWDSTTTPANAYSAPLVLIPSAKVNPSISTPTAAQVLNTDTVTTTWTVSEQSAFRVRLLTNPGGQVVHDSGFVSADTGTLSYLFPLSLPTGNGYTIELTTKNNEGLSSTTQTRNFSVVYAPPPAMLSTFTPVPSLGYITVTPSALAAVGLQPSIASANLWRRKAITPVLNTNTDFAANVTGWQQGGGGAAGTLAFSTTQSHSGTGSARYTPPAASGAAVQTVQSSALFTITPGSLYYASGWIRPDTASKPIVINLDWYDASNVSLSSTTTTVATPVALAWQFIEVYGDPAAIANAAKVRVSIGESGTPLNTHPFYADDISLEVYNDDPGIRISLGGAPTAAVNDSGAASRTEYEYRWQAIGSNGTSIMSPWLS